MPRITATQNPHIKAVAQLHTSKGRKKQKSFIVEGLRALQTFLQAGWKPMQLYVTESKHTSLVDLRSNYPELVKEITIVSDQVMQKISASTTPSGILGVFAIPEDPEASQLSPGLVLAQIADPGNMGTLIRTTAAMDKKTVVVIEGVDPWSPKVVQASAGTIALVNIFRWSWQQLLDNKKDLQLYALTVSEGDKPEELDLRNCLLVVGSEAHGLPQEWKNECDKQLTLQMPGKAESLNAAIAGSIALYLSFLQSINKP